MLLSIARISIWPFATRAGCLISEDSESICKINIRLKRRLFLSDMLPQTRVFTRHCKSKGIYWFFKPTLYLKDGKVKGNVDAELVLHAMIEYANYEEAVIVTGDGDFYCLIDHLVKQGKLLRLIIPDRHRYSSLLREFMPRIAFMNNLREKLEYKKA